MKDSTRILANTGVLYTKMIITTIISLYSVRLVLAALGEVDYGIHNVIMGIVGMLSFLNSAMTVSTQRYLSYNKGHNDKALLSQIFTNSLIIHIVTGIVIMIGLEVVGGYAIYNWLQIPADRVDVAVSIFHATVLSVFFTVVAVPYSALINANERMEFVAIVSVVESFLKLAIALFITYTQFDRLLLYGIAIGGIQIVSFVLYYLICMIKFNECHNVRLSCFNKEQVSEMSKFIGWNFIGAITAMSKNQGISVIFNIFQGPVVNAAFAVANQISAQLNFFSATMIRAINPQIMKAEGSGNRQHMLDLSTKACKHGFLLLAFFSIPCIFEMEYLLNLWLKETPMFTVVFSQLILIAMLFDQLTVGINSSFQAANLVKYSSLYVGAVKLLIIPVGCVLLYVGLPSYTVIIGYAIVELMGGIVRIILAKTKLQYPVSQYILMVCKRVFMPVLMSSLVCLLITIYFEPSILRLGSVLITSSLVFLMMTYLTSLDSSEKNYVLTMINKLKR